jgi:cytochrome P450
MKIKESITNISKFLNQPLAMARDLERKANDVERVYIGPKPFKYVYSPDIALGILTVYSDAFRQNKTIFDRIMPVTGKKGLVQLQGEESKRMRKLIMPNLLSPEAMSNVSEIVSKNVGEIIADLSRNQADEYFDVDISKVMTKLILKSAFEIFLGIDLDEIDDQVVKDYLDLNSLCGDRMRSIAPAPLMVPSSRNRKINKLSKTIRGEVLRILKENGTGTLLTVLEYDENIIDHCLTFLFAGHETMAASLSFAFLKVANFKDSQDSIRSGDKKKIKAFYNETLRMYPPAYMLVRECIKNSEINNNHFLKNDQIIIPLTELHRCPNNFPKPDTFMPERFLTSKHHKGSFLPFGIGPKSCAGTGMAYLEAQIILTEICKHFELKRESIEIKTEAYITLHPSSEQVITFKKRNCHD